MKIAICIPPAKADCYGHHTAFATQVAQVAVRRAIDVEVLRFADSNFMPRLFANMADENCVIYFNSFLYDLRIATSPAEEIVMHAMEGCRAKTVAFVSDHPFATFMQTMIRNAHASTRFVVIDPCFAEEMKFMNATLDRATFLHSPFMPPLSYDRTLAMPFEQREFDLVLPVFLTDLSGQSFDSAISSLPDTWIKRAAAAAYEIVVSDLTTDPFWVFDKCVRDATGGITLSQIREHKSAAVPGVLSLLGILDGFARQVRRHRVVKALLRSVGDLKVVCMSNPLPSLSADKRVKFVGNQSATECARFMASARSVLNCQPTYPASIPERISVGMLYESCVITDVNPLLERTFSNDNFVEYRPESTMTIADVFQSFPVADIATRGAAAVRSKPGFSWDAHFDDILRAANA